MKMQGVKIGMESGKNPSSRHDPEYSISLLKTPSEFKSKSYLPASTSDFIFLFIFHSLFIKFSPFVV